MNETGLAVSNCCSRSNAAGPIAPWLTRFGDAAVIGYVGGSDSGSSQLHIICICMIFVVRTYQGIVINLIEMIIAYGCVSMSCSRTCQKYCGCVWKDAS